MLGKLIEKTISYRLQVHSIASSFIHPSQLGGIKQHSTINAGIFLTHLIRAGWVKGLHTSTLAFDIVQFFPSLNHCLLPMILTKAPAVSCWLSIQFLFCLWWNLQAPIIFVHKYYSIYLFFLSPLQSYMKDVFRSSNVNPSSRRIQYYISCD